MPFSVSVWTEFVVYLCTEGKTARKMPDINLCCACIRKEESGMDRHIKALLGMMAVSLFWAPSFSVTKGLLACAGPISLVCLRFLLAALTFTGYRLIRYLFRASAGTVQDTAPHKAEAGSFGQAAEAGRASGLLPAMIRKEDRAEFLLLTAMMPAHYVLSNIASVTLDETESMMFSSFQGLLTLVIASLLLNSKIRPFTSIYTGTAGVGAVLLMEFQPMTSAMKAGYVIMLTAMVMWVIYCVLLARTLERYSIQDILFYQFWAVGILFLPWLRVQGEMAGAWDARALLGMAYLAVCCTAMCFSLNGAGIREIGPVPASLVLIVGPALVVILKMLDTGGCLSMRQLVGIGLVITGFVLVVLDVVGLGAEGRGEKEKGGR